MSGTFSEFSHYVHLENVSLNLDSLLHSFIYVYVYFCRFSLRRTRSEFGGITIADTLTDDSPLHAKTAFHAKLRELDLPYVLYFTGPFADWISKLSGPNDGKIIITGEGEKKISFTSLKDVTDFVAYTLTGEWLIFAERDGREGKFRSLLNRGPSRRAFLETFY